MRGDSDVIARAFESVSHISQTLDEIGAPTEDDHGRRLNPNGRLTEWLAGTRGPRHTGVSEASVVRHRPMRYSDVAAWIKATRDEYKTDLQINAPSTLALVSAWHALDDLLNDYRIRAVTGALLNEPVSEGPDEG